MSSPSPPDSSATDPAPTAQSQQQLAALRHDLFTPINQIIGYSELLEEELADQQPAVAADLRKIQQAAANLVALIRTRLVATLLPGSEATSRPTTATAPAPDPAGQEPLAPPATTATSAERARTGRILAVDDDALNRDMLASRLLRQGHRVTTAADGEEALELLKHQHFDLVLLDVMMPRLDGYGTLARLKADEQLRHLPVIMISALDELASVVRCIEAGAEDYLPKPFNATLLRARIGACLEKKALRDQELELYQKLVLSQQRLDRELQVADRYVEGLAADLREDGRVAPLLSAFRRMAAAVSLRETELRATIKELEIKINASDLSRQVRTIVSDPAFSALADRARAMRQQRAARLDG